jgi:HAD superfamily hydrolase (TIGR01509 family)
MPAHDAKNATSKLSVKGIFFDFEGTLVDFQWQLIPAVNECLSALELIGFKREWYGPNPSYASIYNQTVNLSENMKKWTEIQRGITIINEIYDKFDADALTRWKPLPDTLEIITTLNKQGFELAIVSNIGGRALMHAIERFGLSSLVNIIISRNDVERLKPDPEGLLKASTQLQIDPQHIIFIGDSRIDSMAARNAGMRSGYLSGGEDTKSLMTQSPADFEIHQLNQLPAYLERLF